MEVWPGRRFNFSVLPIPLHRRALFEANTPGDGTVAQADVIAIQGADGGRRQFPTLPGDVHLEAAAGAQARHATLGPGLRQRGQQLNFAVLALQQHFHDAGRAAKVAINLERRAGVKQVGIGTFGAEEILQNAESMVAFVQPRPEVDAPGRAPAGGLIAADLQGFLHGGGEFGRGVHIHSCTRKQAVQMRDVAVMQLVRLEVQIGQPFLQLAGAANLHRREPRPRGGNLPGEWLVRAENFRRAEAVVEQIAEDFQIHRRPGANAGLRGRRIAIFRRERRTGDEPAVVRLLHERVEEELRRAFERRIDMLEIAFIAGEQIVFP